ncbi:hypothetical protein PpBr36_08590 [Pyricularia pennisetigena]|uniref:hypothetical protein n=1 Tax=Pyricularia pennisetigena TaxID=1578925 RepID=UPI0011544898|nr:hypothetical protein PpBr36_08590 [Pyricularia pennisetigena]TLS24619.1 hypothetical protein PpBr36_08590 [Pyricularia pennisetigena]
MALLFFRVINPFEEFLVALGQAALRFHDGFANMEMALADFRWHITNQSPNEKVVESEGSLETELAMDEAYDRMGPQIKTLKRLLERVNEYTTENGFPIWEEVQRPS